MPTVFGHGLVGPKGVGNSGYRAASAASPIGNQVNIPELEVWLDGNVYSVNEVGVIPQKSYLFLLFFHLIPGIYSVRDGDRGGGEYPFFRGIARFRFGPGKSSQGAILNFQTVPNPQQVSKVNSLWYLE